MLLRARDAPMPPRYLVGDGRAKGPSPSERPQSRCRRPASRPPPSERPRQRLREKALRVTLPAGGLPHAPWRAVGCPPPDSGSGLRVGAVAGGGI